MQAITNSQMLDESNIQLDLKKSIHIYSSIKNLDIANAIVKSLFVLPCNSSLLF